jgi:hypothetical protein
MIVKAHTKKVIVLAIFTMVMPFAFASLSISGTVDEKTKNNRFSLKNISNYSHKSFSMSLLRNNLHNKGNFELKSNPMGGSQFNSYIQLYDGNTTYVMPYKLKIKVPKFKTPSPNN